MRRVLPLLIVVVAVGVTLFLALSLLRDDGGTPDAEDGPARTTGEDEVPSAALAGTADAQEPAASVKAGRFRVRGRVVDADGQPLAGIRVVAVSGGWRLSRKGLHRRDVERIVEPRVSPPEPDLEGVSGADGSFTLPTDTPERYVVRALVDPPRRSTSEYAYLAEYAPTVEVLVRVLDGTDLEGRVVDSEGRGVAAVVEGSVHDREASWSCYADPTRTDPEGGTFRLASLPAGRWRVWVTVPGRVRLTGFRVDVPYDGVWTVRLGEASGRVAGRVTAEADTPVVGASVLISTSRENQTFGATAYGVTDADGRYLAELALEGEIVEVKVLHDDFVALEAAPPLAPWSGAVVKAGEETRLDLSLLAGATVHGRVREAGSGAPLAGAEVFVLGASGGSGMAPSSTTGADGRFRMAGVPPGRHVLLAEHPTHYQAEAERRRTRTIGHEYMRTTVEVLPPELVLTVGAEDRVIERDLVLERGLLVEGRVLGAGDVPCPDATIRATEYGLATVARRWGVEEPSASQVLAHSDAEGRFRIEGLPPRDEWLFYAQKSPLVTVPADPVAIVSGQPTPEITLRLEGGATIAGRVIGPDGEGTAARVYAYSTGPYVPGRTSPHAVTDADGTFRLEGVPTGGVRLMASTKVLGSVTEVVEGLAAGEVRENVALNLAKGVRLSGVLVDPDGDPVPNHSLVIQGVQPRAGGASTIGVTDEKGAFVFPNAPEGKVQFRVFRSRGGISTSVNVGEPVDSPASDLRLVLKPESRCVVEGRVVGPDDQPIPLCRVAIQSKSASTNYYGNSTALLRKEEVVDGAFRREVEGEEPFTVLVTDPRDGDGRPLNLQRARKILRDPDAEPVVIKLESGVEVEGRVVGPDGAGVPEVLLQNSVGAVWTDAEGRFRLGGFAPQGDRIQVEVPPGYVRHPEVPVGDGRRALTIELEPALTISGAVVGEDGEPAPRASVSAQWTTERGGQGYGSAPTGTGGRFEIAGVPADATATLTCRVWGGQGHSASATVSDVEAGASDVVIRVGEGVTIDGRAVRADGEPLKGGHLRIWPVGETSRANWASIGQDGTFRITGLTPGLHVIVVHDSSGGPPAEDVEVRAPATGIEIVMPASVTIQGRVVGDGSLAGLHVTAHPIAKSVAHRQRSAQIQADGTFTIRNVGGKPYRLVVRGHLSDHYGLAGPVEPGATDVVIELQEGLSLSGVLEDAAGEPIAQGHVWAKGDAVSAYAPVKDGLFQIRALPPGRYRMQAGTGPVARPQDVGEAEAGATNLRLQLP